MAVHITRAGVALTVGIIVLTGLVVGGLLWVRHAGEQARRDDALHVAEQNLEAQSNQEVALNEGNEATKDADKDANKDTASNRDATRPNNANRNGSESSAAREDEAESAADELPQTGPADNLLAIVGAGAITWAGTAYLRSRRSLF